MQNICILYHFCKQYSKGLALEARISEVVWVTGPSLFVVSGVGNNNSTFAFKLRIIDHTQPVEITSPHLYANNLALREYLAEGTSCIHTYAENVNV